jgi:hypothetical protein
VEFSGPTFRIGECDTKVIDPTYDLCSCTSLTAAAIAACTSPACVESVQGLSEATIAAIISSPCDGANSVLEFSIMASTAVTFGTQSVLHGCALAQSAVTFENGGSVVTNHYVANGARVEEVVP